MKNLLFLFAATLLVSCGNNMDVNESGADSKEERNKKIIRESYDGMQQLNASKMLENLAPNAVDYGEGSMKVEGADSIKAAVGMWLAALESFKVDDLTLIAEGDKVWAFATYTSKYKDDVMGMQTKGKTVTLSDVDMFTLNDDGKITSHRSVQSMDAFYNKIGEPGPHN